jgi:hypothetical protein
MSYSTDPKEVQEMREQLAAARKAARGVKDSARNLRALPRSRRLAAVTAADLERYDSLHPMSTDDTTKRMR